MVPFRLSPGIRGEREEKRNGLDGQGGPPQWEISPCVFRVTVVVFPFSSHVIEWICPPSSISVASIKRAAYRSMLYCLCPCRWASIVLVFFLLCQLEMSDAFTHSPAIRATSAGGKKVSYGAFQSSCLPAKRKKDEGKEKLKQEWDVTLLIQFMTPWKNPNSIFVYLFLTLYILGTISESRN